MAADVPEMAVLKPNLPIFALALLAAACGKHQTPTEQPGNAATAASNVAAATRAEPQMPAPQSAPAPFSTDAVPLSNVPLGKFPYFGLPPNYQPQNTPITHEFGRFPFWTGKAFRQVEGKTYMLTIIGKNEGTDYSAYELKKNMEALFIQAGAAKMFDGQIPSEAIETLPKDELLDVNDGFGKAYNNPAQIWVIRRPEKEIWIQFGQDTASAGLAVVETKPFVATAILLPADKLKQELDQSGKTVIHVNFATNQATILLESKAQMDAVVALLKQHPGLNLAINGYTDETGSDAHNISLSDARAKAVMTALVAAGTDARRLKAKGYGKSNPIAANTDEAGKAQNRRVELIKL